MAEHEYLLQQGALKHSVFLSGCFSMQPPVVPSMFYDYWMQSDNHPSFKGRQHKQHCRLKYSEERLRLV